MGKKKEQECPPLATWLVTFSDLVTLLLTFFVLLLSMSSMDNSLLTTVTLTTADLGLLGPKGAGRVTAKERLVAELMERPWEVMEKQNRIKDLLFPDQILPVDLSRSELDKNLKVLAKQDGVALVFTDQLLFEPGGSELSLRGRVLLQQLVPLLQFIPAPVNVAGYADTDEAGKDPFLVSGERALSVVTFLVDENVQNKKFTLSAYGDAHPVPENADPDLKLFDRRVEILLKTARPIGSYP